ncbi:DUF418 domain-containing protein [Dietzia kunjamensis]|uniref:DUF418 domain-containing protein n=1 Tax=Dietzia kunjamensis TaxID=322509 RepID=UPI00388EDF0E
MAGDTDERLTFDTTTTGRRRIEELDVIRGFALCGIHVVNVYQQVVFSELFGDQPGLGVTVMPAIVRYGFYERFLPIFTLLFGVGFAIFLASAGNRIDHPRVVLARRLAVLAGFGVLHQLVHPGEALLPYAVFGLVILLPASFLRPRWALAAGLVLLLLGAQTVAGYGVMPGLLVVGYALAGLGCADALGRQTRRWVLAAAISGAVTIAYWTSVAVGIHLPRLSLGATSLPSQLAGVVTGLFYVCLVVLALRTPAGSVLRWALAPMGRMALTNYLLATAFILVLSPILAIDGLDDWPAIVALVVGIIVAQIVASRVWLARFRFGLAEWLWRSATWWEMTPLRR